MRQRELLENLNYVLSLGFATAFGAQEAPGISAVVTP